MFAGDGCFSDTDVVRYGALDSFQELVWDKKSDYSFKEVLFPVSETILYFTENEMKVADQKEKKNLIFLRSCDFHALKRLDQMYLHNGTEDFYYKRMRENTVFAVMGCGLFMRGPYGNGFDYADYRDKELIVVAGGTGVSPVRGVIDYFGSHRDEVKDLSVIVGFRSPADILFRDDLKRWEDQMNLTVTVDASDDPAYRTGLVTKYIPDLNAHVR